MNFGDVPVGVPMDKFFEYIEAMESKWDLKFKSQEERMNFKIESMEAKIELNKIIKDFECASYINGHISKTNTKIALASLGVGTIGVAMIPIPVIGLVGVGITIASAINGIAHVAINAHGKIPMTYDHQLGSLCKANPHISLNHAKAAFEFLSQWFINNPYRQCSDPEDQKNEKDRWYESMPKIFNFSQDVKINIEPILPAGFHNSFFR